MAEKSLSGKLAVILHADVAGSTELVHQDEHLAHQRIQDTFRRFGDIITKYDGNVRELRGDALLAEFDRASDAVTAALAFQIDQSEYLTQLDDTILPMVRVGIAMGEVIIADDTVTGGGVVLAQRVEQIAEPGSVGITGAIQEALPQRMPFDQGSMGEHQVKGFDKPVHVYRVHLKKGAALPEPILKSKTKKAPITQGMVVAAIVALICGGGLLAWIQPWKLDFEPASVEKMVFPLPEKPSIAVLPFDNYSDEEKLDFFADGLTENITSALSKAPGLFVIARNSAATYKGKPVNVKQVAEDLGVQYVLEGSVQQSGEKLRITTQLVDAVEGHHMWTDRFDRPTGDVFAVQDEITKRVFAELQVELTEGEHARIAAVGTNSLDAWLLRIEAYGEFLKFTRESQIRARQLYEAAHQADPNWAFPVAGVAFTHWWEAKRGWSTSRKESIRKGIELAEQAIGLQPDDPIGYIALGNLMFLIDEPEKGVELRRKAMELAPNSFVAVGGFAIRLAELGQGQEAVELFERAIRLSPKHPWWVEAGYGLALHLVGRKEEAVEMYEAGINKGAQSAAVRARLAAVYADLGQMDAAKAAVDDALRLNPKFTVATYQKSYPFPTAERNEWYKDLLVRSGLPEDPPLELPDKPSIAVLPFTNISGDTEQEYFVDGMTENLITDLSKISGLFVIASNSSFTYKGKTVDVKIFARDLGVHYVLEGSVRRVGDQVRINAQLIDASSGGHIWAERYDGSMVDVFALQDQVTEKIVTALAVTLTANEKVVQARVQTKSAQAYDAFLRGLEHYRRDTTGHYEKAMRHFQEAVELDPGYSRAYAAMASIYWKSYLDEFYQMFRIGRTEARERGQHFLKKALRDPTSLAYQVASDISLWRRDHDTAIKHAENAIALDSNNAQARLALANALIFSGRPSDAIKHIDLAEEVDPFGKARYEYVRGVAFFSLEQYDQAAESLERARELNPLDWAANEPGQTWCYPCEILASTYGHLERLDDAQSVIGYLNQFGYHRGRISGITPNWPYKEAADAERFVIGLSKAGLPE